MKFIREQFSNFGRPRIAIVACVHGDEIIGLRVFRALKKNKIKKGSIDFIIANPKALERKVRYIETDLNRSFPGKKSGAYEERVAYELRKTLQNYDVVIDIHATNSNIDELAIVTALNKAIKGVLKLLPVTKVAYVKKNTFGGNELINFCPAGVSLEYGPNKSGRNYQKAVFHIKSFLVNLGMIEGKQIVKRKKMLFPVSRKYEVPKYFIQNRKLVDFRLIKKGELLGKIDKKDMYSSMSFYPLFLGRGKYEKTLALVAPAKKALLC